MKVAIPAIVAAFVTGGPALAHEKALYGKKTEKSALSTIETAFGREGNPRNVVRTIKVDMSDAMRFTPAAIAIRRGETIRFEVRNSGRTIHEMVLGTMKELKDHAEVMKKHPGMEHDEPYMAHVAPGKTERIVWQFTRPGEFYYGCLIPGHFEAGMIGTINVSAR